MKKAAIIMPALLPMPPVKGGAVETLVDGILTVSYTHLDVYKRQLYDDADCFSILACHRANLYPFFKDLNTNLMLSGHLHGGIVRLPGLGGIVGENMELHPDYTYGEYDEGHTKMIVSRGCDYNLLKMRVFNGPEVLLVTLRSER